MKVKVTKGFVAGVETYPAGQSADLPDEVAGRVISIGWAEPEEADDKRNRSSRKKHDNTGG